MLVSIDYIDYKYIGFLSRLKIAASKELLSPFDLLLVKRTLSKATELAGKGSSVRGDFGLVR
jgi:histidinol-phosphate/aromatic aminotransferase/cobyric acid decarboxylase-like protein